jgi:NADH:ubiquinone oxidoreductase subunit 6 (subunit J)
MPGGDFHPVAFSIIAAWILVCAVGVVTFKNIVHSAVSMVFCFVGVAAIYLLLNASLVAIIQLLVYVGAISVVILFAIMLTEAQGGDYRLFFNRQTVFAFPLAVAVATVVTVILVSSRYSKAIAHTSLTPSLADLSKLLFNAYVLPFELVSLVLLAAMIGAIVLARREDELK